MGHGIHAGGGGKLRRQTQGHIRVQQRVVRNQGKVIDGILVTGLAVGDDSGQGGLAAGAGGGGHRDEQRQPAHHMQQALHLVQLPARPGNAGAAGLGAVHRRTAAEGNDRLAAVRQIAFAGSLHIGDGGVGDGVGKKRHPDIGFGQGILQRPGQVMAEDAPVSDQKHLMDVPADQQVGQSLYPVQELGLPVGQKGQCHAKRQLIGAAVNFAQRIHNIPPGNLP